jgi:hypothetical protein
MTIVFMDTECTGLSPEDHIWEWAAIRRDDTGHVERYHCFVQHDVSKAERLPESFRADHAARYNPDEALTLDQFVSQVRMACAGRPHIVGAVPNFNTERIARILALYDLAPSWHYHLRDTENVAIGYLQGRASLGDVAARAALDNVDDSNALSRACGVEPPGDGVRHTAMGDVEWSMSLYDAVMDGPPANAWIVPKVDHPPQRLGVYSSEGTSDPEHARFYAAQLLAAADESERIVAQSGEVSA